MSAPNRGLDLEAVVGLAATTLAPQFANPQEGQRAPEQERRDAAADLHHPRRDERVALRVRVVAIAIQDRALDGGDTAAFARLEQADADVVRRVLEPVQVA